MTTKTKITLPITITLNDPRYCTGRHLRRYDMCVAFPTKRGTMSILRVDYAANRHKRLPQCIAATGGSDA